MRESAIPYLLQQIADAPKRLYIRGSFPAEHFQYLTVIGSRKYTPYGREALEHLMSGLSGYPIAIVSGLALGIDTLAHRAALANNLPTIAFPGSGLHDSVLYPASNRRLGQQILEAGGALVSEFEPMAEAAYWTFPQRNRLMAGISQATLVIEAGNKSGSRITAKLATEYNRDVLTLPGSIFSAASEGTNQLLREGATPITSSADIITALGITETETVFQEQLSLCSPEEQLVLELLVSPTSRNDLVRGLDMSTAEANVLISAMEIKGLIIESLGKYRRG